MRWGFFFWGRVHDPRSGTWAEAGPGTALTDACERLPCRHRFVAPDTPEARSAVLAARVCCESKVALCPPPTGPSDYQAVDVG